MIFRLKIMPVDCFCTYIFFLFLNKTKMLQKHLQADTTTATLSPHTAARSVGTKPAFQLQPKEGYPSFTGSGVFHLRRAPRRPPRTRSPPKPSQPKCQPTRRTPLERFKKGFNLEESIRSIKSSKQRALLIVQPSLSKFSSPT